MGAGVAGSLLCAGFSVHAYDVRSSALERFAADGGVPCASAAEVGKQCDVVIVLVVDATQTDAALFGEQGAVAAMRPGSVVIACATVAPELARQLGARVEAAGLQMLDAPVSGGVARAVSGELTMMTSGPAAAYAACEDVLAAIAAKVYRLGEAHGVGSKVKIINQLLAGVHIAAAAEALALGAREGVDPEVLYDVITHSAGNSWMFENRVRHYLDGDKTSLSAVDIFVKDLGLVLDTARSSKFPLPLSATAHQMFMNASSSGYGRDNDLSVIRTFPGMRAPTDKTND